VCRQHGEAYANKDFEQTLYHVTKTGRSMSHFPRDGIEDIANTEPGYEVRIANNVVHVATNDVPANQKFLHLKIPHFSSNGVAAVVKAGVWMRGMLLRSLSASPPNQSPLPASSGTLFATSFRCRPAAERTVSRRCNVPEHIFIGAAEFPKDADDIRELFEECAAWLARHDVEFCNVGLLPDEYRIGMASVGDPHGRAFSIEERID
jgi:hypothetical protein